MITAEQQELLLDLISACTHLYTAELAEWQRLSSMPSPYHDEDAKALEAAADRRAARWLTRARDLKEMLTQLT